MNKFGIALFLLFFFFLQTACIEGDGPEENEIPISEDSYPGLSVSPTGQLLLNGEPFYGIGVNYFNAFTRTLEQGKENDKSYEIGFAYLKERDIPFIRFSLNGYWPKNWDLYKNNPDRFYKNLDTFVKTAEEYGIGLIPSFFWHNPTIPDLVGESVNQWGNVNSKTHEFMRKFTQEIVVRYRNSQAIWGWELGNEFNLLVDLPGNDSNLPPVVPSLGTPTNRTKEDKLSTSDLQVMLKSFANEIRKYDHSRIIISGNAIPRPAAWHLRQSRQWTADTKDQFIQMLGVQNIDPVDNLSVHIYPSASDEAYFSDGKEDIDGIVKACMDASRQLKKPLFVGEWGAQEVLYGSETPNKFVEILSSIEKNQVPLSAMWVFDYPPHDTEEGINVSPDNGKREYMLQQIKEANIRIKTIAEK